MGTRSGCAQRIRGKARAKASNREKDMPREHMLLMNGNRGKKHSTVRIKDQEHRTQDKASEEEKSMR